jgi:SagB-type dehydrogenase family enzyme
MEGDMNLPQPHPVGQVSLEEAIKRRRTIRSFNSASLTLDQLSQLLWAAQGITEEGGFKRAAASGGALYPMDIYAVVGRAGVEGLQPGIYYYEAKGHTISLLLEGDFRESLARAPLNLVVAAQYGRITSKYGERGVRYALMEAGHVGQNIFLQAEALGLGAGIVGAFPDDEVIQVLKILRSHEPLLIMPVGNRR